MFRPITNIRSLPASSASLTGASSSAHSGSTEVKSSTVIDPHDEVTSPTGERKVMLRDTAVHKLLSMKRSTKVSLPPVLQTTIRTRHTYRFRVNSTANLTPIGLGGLIGAMGVYGKTTTVVNAIHTAVRLRSLKIWLPATTTNTFFIDWVGTVIAGISPDSSTEASTPDGVTITGCIKSVPPRGSLAREWLNTGSLSSLASALFTINAPVGTIIDLTADGCISNTVTPSSITVTTAVVGSFYYLALDGPSSNKIIPQGLTTTS